MTEPSSSSIRDVSDDSGRAQPATRNAPQAQTSSPFVSTPIQHLLLNRTDGESIRVFLRTYDN